MQLRYQQPLRRLGLAFGAAFCLFFLVTALTAQPVFAAEINVETTTDEANLNVPNGLCSLREAIINANENDAIFSDCPSGDATGDTIVLPAGVYNLTIAGGSYSYDFDITDGGPLTITGAGARNTIINGDTLPGSTQSRIFEIQSDAVVTIQDLTITGGYVSNNNDGGGIRVAEDATLTVQRVALVDNWSSRYGGAIHNEGTLFLIDSLLNRNTVNFGGGGLANFATATVTNTTISNNAVLNFGAAGGGGGITNLTSAAQLSLAYTTVYNNAFLGITNGVNLHNNNGNVTVTASIVALDSLVGQAPSCSGVFSSGGYNIDSGNTCAFSATSDLSNTAPLLGALVNAGGPTDVHPLQANSPAVDNVPNGAAGCGGAVVTDQRGESRPQDGDGDNVADCDSGASELASVTGSGGFTPIDVSVLTTVINSGNGPLSNPAQPLGPNPVVSGESYRFFVEIENLDQVNAASGVIVHDTLIGLSAATLTELLPAVGWACSFGGGQLLCSYTGDLLGNGSPTPVAEVEIIIDAAQPGGVISHYLQASTLNPDVDLSNNACDLNAATVDTADDCVTFTVETEATLSLEVGDLNEPLIAGGDAVIYPVVVSNSGPSAAANVAVSAAVPADLVLVSLSAGDVMTCTHNIATGTGACTIPTIPAGDAVTFYAAVRAASAAATGTVNALSVEVTTADNTTFNQPSIVEETRVDAVADLSVTQNGPLRVTVGGNAVYTLTIANNGPSDIAGVVVTDTLPAQMTFVSAVGATCSATGRVVTCSPFDLAAGASQQVIVTAAVDASVCYAGSVTNNVVIGPDRYVTDVNYPVLTLPLPDAANNQAQWTHEIASAANLSVTKSVVNSPVNAGDVVEFAIQVTNSGPGCAPNVFVLDELNSNDNPDGLEQVEYYAFQSTQGDNGGLFSGWYYVCTSGICGRGTPMPAGTTDTIQLFARVPADTPAGNYTNWVNVFSTDAPGPNDTPVEDASAQWTVTADADLSIAKTLLTPGTVAPGGLLQYEIVVTNNGPSVATGINVTDTLSAGFPAGTQIVAASPECTGAPATQITCAVENLWPGQRLDFLVMVQAGLNVAGGATIENCAAVNDLPGGVNNACAAAATVGNSPLPNANLEIVSMSCSPVLPGSSTATTACTVIVTNSGPGTAANVTLAQRLINLIPQGTSLSFATTQQGVNPNTLWNCAAGLTCSRTAPMAPGAVDTLTFNFRTLPDAHLNAFGQPIQVQAAVTSSNPDTSLFDNRATVSPSVEPSADLRVDKVALSQNPAPGGTVLFAVTVYNDGFSDVDGIAIDDLITSGNATILNITPAGTVYIAAGASQQFLVTAQIDDTATPGDTVTNQVTVNTSGVIDGLSTLATATGYNGAINNVLTDTVSVTVGGALPAADISVSNGIVHNTSPIVAGGLYSFTVSVSNLGPAQAQGVVVHDLLLNLPGAQIVDVVTAPNWLCSGALTCTRSGPMPVASETVATVTVTIPASTPAGAYLHRLAASADSPDPVPANNSSEIFSFSVTTQTSLSLNVDDVNAILTAGDAPTRHPIQVTNDGPSDAANVGVTVTLPPGFVLSALQGELPIFCNLGAAGCTIPTIPAGSSRTIYADVAALSSALPAVDTPILEACIGSTEICDTENGDVVTRADLLLDKRATATVNAGDTITYTIDVLNLGPSDAQNVQVIDTLPTGVTLESAGACTENGGVITCPATTLAAGASQSYSILVRTDAAAQPGSSLENVAVVSSSTADLNTLNNQDGADTSIVGLAALSLTKTAGAATVNAGESVTFDIVVANAGPSTAANVTVEDALPVGLTLVEASVDLGNGPQPCGGVLCGVGDLASGTSATVRITALAAADLAAGTVLTNVAQVRSATAEADLADNRAQAAVTVTTLAQITLNKEDLLDPVVVNDLAGVDDLAYIVTVANVGPSAAAAVQVTDTLPAGVVGRAFVFSSSWAGAQPGGQLGTCSGAGELVCDLGAIPAGEQVQIYVTADVQDPLLCGTEVTNQAAASWSDSRGAIAATPVTAGTGLLCQSGVSVQKSGPDTVSLGESATYVITVTNSGRLALLAGQLTLSDLTPPGLTFEGITAQSGTCAFSGASPWTNSATLAAGESCSVALEYTVNAAACPVGVLLNRAQVSTQFGDSDQDIVLTTVACDTVLDISLTPDFFPDELVAGNIVDFLITVANLGDVTAFDVELTGNVFFPLFGARIVDFFPQGAFSAGECTNNGFCNLGDLPAGEEITVVASVEIDSDQALFFANTLVKDACAEANNAERICLADVEQRFDEPILSDVELDIFKQVLFDPIVVSGGSVSADGFYILEVANDGPSDAFGVVISDTLPVGMVVSDEPLLTTSFGYGPVFFDCSLNGDGIGDSVGSNQLLCLLDSPLPAGETVQILVPVGFAPATAANFCVEPNNSFTNVAEVQWFDDIDGEQSFLSNEVTSNFVCRGDVDVIKSGPAVVTYAEAAAGFTYAVTVQNTGPSPIVAGALTVTDTLPAALFFDAAAFAAATVDGGACVFATGAQTGDSVIVFTNGAPLGAGESCTVTFGVTTAPNGQSPAESLFAAGDLFNVATVAYGNDRAQAVWQTQIDFSTQLTVTKAALTPVVAGQEAIFEIVITNTGDAPAFDLLLIDNVNARSPVDLLGARIVNMSILGQPAGLCSDGGLCRIDQLAAQESVTVLATVLVDADSMSSEVRQQACIAAANAETTCAAVTAEIERVTDVRIRKDDLGNLLVAGGAPVQYIITVWNEDGPSTAYDVVVRDDMFPGFVLVGDLEPGNQRIDCPDIPGAGDNVCIIRALRPGDSVELYATVAAVADAVDAVETPVNQACIVEIDGVPLAEPVCDTESTNVVTQADLALVKNAPATVGAGDLITYTIDVSNLGPSLAQNVSVADVLPAGLALISVSASQGGCNSLPCVLGTMPVGSSAVVTILARVAGDALVGSSIENVATVSASTTDPNPTNDSDDADTSIVTVADLSITKQTAVVTATAGLPITYTVVVRNAGPGRARNVTVQDALPPGMTLLSATVTPPQGDPFLCAGTLCAVGDLDAGESATITLIARVDPAYNGATITNRATVTSLAFDPAPADNDSGPVTTPVTQQADLTIAKRSLPDVAVPGERLTYEITVRNVGPSDAAGVTVDDLLPVGFTPLTVRSSQAGCSSLPCTLGTIPAGASASVTVVGAVEASLVDALVNTAAVTAQTSLVNTADDSVTLSTPISALADLYIQKFGTPTVNAGEAIAYTLRVVNQGPSDAQNVQVIDSLPPGVNVTGDGGCTLADGALTCVLGTVAAGQTAQIDLSATAAITLWPGTRLENRATVTSSTPDRTQADNVAVAATNIVGAADLSLSQSGPGTVVAGTEIQYTIVVTNNGPSLARGVDVRDSLPSGLTLLEATIQRSGRSLQLCGGTVCQLGEMVLGESAVVTLRALVGPNLPAGTILTNTATTFSVTEDGNPANNSASVETVVITSADIQVSVLDLSDPVQPTGGFVYDISLTNNGPSMARGVVITSVLDSNVTFASISPLCPFNDGLLVCNVGNLAVGGRVRFLLAVVAADVPNGTLLVNTVTATTTTPDPLPENNTASEITIVQLGFGPSSDIGVSKSASQPVVDAGSLVTYTMVISNAGPAEAADVKLIEVIPPGTRLVGIRVNNPAFASATCALSGLCLLGKVPLGVNVIVTATLLVERNYADILVNNLVTVISDQIDPQPRNNIAVSVVEVIPFVALPSVRIEKALSPTGAAVNGIVPVGERITFTIDIANIGELQIVDMPLFDTYDPTKLVFVRASPPPSNSSLGVIRWDNLLPGVVSLAPGDSFQVITVFETVGSSATSIDGVTENIALVNAAEGQNGETAPAVSSVATVKITSPSVSIRKSVDASTPTVVLPGDLITFSITVSNTGDTRLTTIPVVDRFDDNHLAFVSAEIAPTAILAEEVRWADVGDLEAEETLSFTVTFRLIADVPFVNNVAALGVVLDANGDSAFDNSTGQMLAEVGVARLGFELDALPAPGTEIRPGDVITYYLRLHNRGGIPLSNATLLTQVPEGTTLLRFDEVPSPLGAMSAPLSIVPATGDGTVYQWKFAMLEVNQSFETLMIVQVDRESTRQVISMDAVYGSDEIATGQSNELTHPLSPTAITLDAFTVEQTADGVLVRWQTAAEVNSWGFYVLRSVYGEGVPVRVNTTLIPATGAGSAYEYVDTGALAGINEGIVYEYWLQEVELDGDLIEYGPTLIGQGVERIFLPTVAR